MLIFLKDKLKPIGLLLLGLCLVALLLGTLSSYQSHNKPQTSLAKLGHIELTAQQWQSIQKNNQQSATPLDLPQLFHAWQRHALWLELAKQSSIQAPAEQVMAELKNIPAFQVNGHFDIHQTEQVLAQHQTNIDQLLQDFQQIETASMIENMLAIALMLPPNWDRLVNLISMEHRSGCWLQVHAPAVALPTKQELLKSFYEDHQSAFTNPPKWQVSYVVVPVDAMNVPSPSQAEMESWYHDHLAQFTEAENWDLNVWYHHDPHASLASLLEQKKQLAVTDKQKKAKPTSTDKLEQSPKDKKDQEEKKLTTWQFEKIGKIGTAPLPESWRAELSHIHQPKLSHPIIMQDGQVYVIDVKSYQASYVKPLTDQEVSAQVTKDWQKQQREKRAVAWMKQYDQLYHQQRHLTKPSEWTDALHQAKLDTEDSILLANKGWQTDAEIKDDNWLSQPEAQKILRHLATAGGRSEGVPVFVKQPQPAWLLVIGFGYQLAYLPPFDTIMSQVKSAWLVDKQFEQDRLEADRLLANLPLSKKLQWHVVHDVTLKTWSEKDPKVVGQKLFEQLADHHPEIAAAHDEGVFIVQTDDIQLPDLKNELPVMLPMISSAWSKDLMDYAVTDWIAKLPNSVDQHKLKLAEHDKS